VSNVITLSLLSFLVNRPENKYNSSILIILSRNSGDAANANKYTGKEDSSKMPKINMIN
jgi:hypothetical protein